MTLEFVLLALVVLLIFLGLRSQKMMQKRVQRQFERTTQEFLEVVRSYRSPAVAEEPKPRRSSKRGRPALVRILEGEDF